MENRNIKQGGAEEGEPVPFEQALGRLESIVHELEEGSTGLADGLARYEEGVALLKQCHALLERAERRVELLTGVDAAGQAQTTPLDDEAQTLETKSRTRSQRRSRSAQRPESEAADDPNGAARPPAGDDRGLFD